jgi:hypothetical protein
VYVESVVRSPVNFDEFVASLTPAFVRDEEAAVAITFTVLPLIDKDVAMVLEHPGLNVWVIKRLRTIPFTASMIVALGEPPAMVPDFFGTGCGTRIEMTYTAPDDQHLLLALPLGSGEPLLVALDPVSMRTHYPALPNTYRDCRLCTGSSEIPDKRVAMTVGLGEYIRRWLKAWNSAPFNNDLVSSGEGSVEAVCRFDPNTMTNIPVDWRRVSPRVALGSRIGEILAAVEHKGILA